MSANQNAQAAAEAAVAAAQAASESAQLAGEAIAGIGAYVERVTEEAEEQLHTTRESAKSEVTETKVDAVETLEGLRQAAFTEMTNLRNSSVSEVETTRDNAKSQVNATRDAAKSQVEGVGSSAISTMNGLVTQSQSARDAAQTAKSGAESARDAAQTAKAGAETARDTASGHADIATTKASEASASAITAQTAAGNIPALPVLARNLATRPSVEVGTTGWGNVNGGAGSSQEVSTEQVRPGRTRSWKFTYGAAASVDGGPSCSAGQEVEAGKTYRVRIWAYTPALLGSGIRAAVFGSSGTPLVTTTRGTLSAVVGAWVRLSVTFTTVGSGRVTPFVCSNTVPAAGSVIYTCDVTMVEQDGTYGETLDYFDGDTPGARWTGTPHASASELVAPRQSDLQQVRTQAGADADVKLAGHLADPNPHPQYVRDDHLPVLATNHLPNDGTAGTTTGWLAQRGTLSAEGSELTLVVTEDTSGVNSVRLEGSSVLGSIPVTPGESIRLDAEATLQDGARGLRIALSFTGPGSPEIAGPWVEPVSGQYLPLSVSGVVPAGATSVRPRVALRTAAGSLGQWMKARNLILQKGSNIRPIPAGDGSDAGWRWTGTPSQSASELVHPPLAALDSLARSALRRLEGSGSPEGSVAATPGTEYLDLSGTNGAWLWRKRTGTAATGWVCVEGDTGLRNIADGFLDSWTGNLYLRRVGSVVEYRLTASVPADTSGSTTVANFPAGFQPRNATTDYRYTRGSSSSAQVVWRLTAGAERSIQVSGPYPAAAGTLTLVGVFITPDAWPTTLPGTAV